MKCHILFVPHITKPQVYNIFREVVIYRNDIWTEGRATAGGKRMVYCPRSRSSFIKWRHSRYNGKKILSLLHAAPSVSVLCGKCVCTPSLGASIGITAKSLKLKLMRNGNYRTVL
jgi:hypothetical protein